ncbi:MAG: thiamine diphosphokinase [Ruminococcus sp.]
MRRTSKTESCVIIGGAEIKNYDEIRQYISKNDFVICCDSGLKHCEKLKVKPELIVGDFDSYEQPQTDIETIVLPAEKDDTDTVFALKEALKRGYDNFIILGAVAGRFDHSLGNLYLLISLFNQGKKGIIVDDFSQMEIVSENEVYIDDSYPYFSLLNIHGKAKGITVENAKYPLKDAEITAEYQYGISNEVIKGKTAKVSVKEGKLLLIKIRHE